MPEAERDKRKFIIFHGYIHFLPQEKDEQDNEIETE